MLRIPSKAPTDSALVPTPVPSTPVDSSALVSQGGDRGCFRKPGGDHRSRFKCDHCHKIGHTVDRCWALHGRTPKIANVAQTTALAPVESASVSQTPPAIFNDFLRWYEDRQAFGSTASIAHTGNSFVGISHSTSVGPWVLDSGGTDHITSNKTLFSSLSTSGYLPSVTMANGSQTQSQGLGIVHPFPSLSVDNVLYVPGSPFNLLSISRLTRTLDCVVSFTKDSVFLQDQSLRQMIGTGCESHGLYHLRPITHAGSAVESPLLIHARLGHPSLQKLQQLVPSLSQLSNLSCESCQLGKHVRSSFPSRLNNRALSPFSLIHSDVWGLSRTMSTLGFRYFVTFIDDILVVLGYF